MLVCKCFVCICSCNNNKNSVCCNWQPLDSQQVISKLRGLQIVSEQVVETMNLAIQSVVRKQWSGTIVHEQTIND